MDPNDYRKQVEAEVEKARAQTAQQAAAQPPRGATKGIASIRALGDKLTTDDATFDEHLRALGDSSEDPATRSAIFTEIHTQSFRTDQFQRHVPKWTAALRALVKDKDPDLRLRALSILSNLKDGYAQNCLLDGLRDSTQAVVAPETALQLLSNDIHADVYPIARAIAAKPPSEAARKEALRVLAADAQSAPLFESLLRNQAEQPDVRRLALAALNTLAPTNLRKHAQQIIMTDGENPEVTAMSLAALAHGDMPVSADLGERVDELSKTNAPEIQLAAARLRTKLGH